MQLSAEDIHILKSRNIDSEKFISNLKGILNSISPTRIEKPCVIGDGIDILSTMESNHYVDLFDRIKNVEKTLFIPASGAATRMFKHLNAIQDFDSDSLTEEFVIRFKDFPFFEKLLELFQHHGKDLNQMINDDEWSEIIHFISDEIGFTQLPKALIPFHQTSFGHRTAFAEQIREGLTYILNDDSSHRFHFTISPDIKEMFEEAKTNITEENSNTAIQIDFSFQDPRTDTPALKGENNFARNKNQELIFRPAGHGALIQNLERIDSDIIFIKNIDNIANEKWTSQITFYKKVLGGVILELREKTYELLKSLETGDQTTLPHAIEFLYQKYGYRSIEEPSIGKVFSALNRPIRVCGMVRNEGEPGGGPFWVLHSNGQISKQIVEKNQIDTSDPIQYSHLTNSTHFNPVDIVCCIKDYNGKKFNLEKFIDHSTSFISDKFQEGQIIKALELPGLWNGSMSGWNSVFIEVPSQTFHPVKTVNDLLRSGHR